MLLEPREAPGGHPQHLPAGPGRVAESIRIPGPRRRDRGEARRAASWPVSTTTSRSRTLSFRYPGSPDGFRFRGLESGSQSRRGGGAGGTERRRQDHHRQPGAAVLRRDRGQRPKIDGRDVRDFNLACLRDQIGMVAQDTFLFNDTVANNIAYGQAGHAARSDPRAPRRPRWRTSSSCGCRKATKP